MDLYTDRNPRTTVKGLGFKNKEKALHTLKAINGMDKTYQKQVVVTMYHRAKYHPSRTRDMEDAMKVFAKWMDKNKINYK